MQRVIEPFIIGEFAASLVVGMSTSHKNKNRSSSGLYFRFHCIIIIGCDGICGSYTREELWAAQAWRGLTLYSVSWCLVSIMTDLSHLCFSVFY